MISILAWLDTVRANHQRDWQDLFRLIESAQVVVDPWDLIVVATELTESNVPGIEPLL